MLRSVIESIFKRFIKRDSFFVAFCKNKMPLKNIDGFLGLQNFKQSMKINGISKTNGYSKIILYPLEVVLSFVLTLVAFLEYLFCT